MKRVVGFALFGIAIGLVIAMLLPNTFELFCVSYYACWWI